MEFTSLEEKVNRYHPDSEKLLPYKTTPLLFVVGISGAGKNTIIEQLLAQHPDQYMPFVTHTTRSPRQNHGILEQDGADYHFIDFATSNQMLDEHQYIEVNSYSGNIYGTSISEIAKAHEQRKIMVADIDVNGAENFIRLDMNTRPVFIVPPSFEVWQQRIQKRNSHGTDTEDLKRRMRTAHDEINHALATEYFYFIVNEDLQASVDMVDQIAHGAAMEKREQRAESAARDILRGIEAILAK